MNIPPYEKGEISCRVCTHFSIREKCWINSKDNGKECKRFVLDGDRARLLPQKKEKI